MNGEKFSNVSDLNVGSVVRKSDKADSLCVISLLEGAAVAVRHAHVSNPQEWAYKSGAHVVSIDSLRRSESIIHCNSKEEYIVMANYGDHCFAVRSETINDPAGWLVLPQISS